MRRLLDAFKTLLHGSLAERRVTRELRMMKEARMEWETTLLDLLDKLNKVMAKYAKRESRELEKAVEMEEPASAAPLDYKAGLRQRAAALTGARSLRTRRMPASTAVENGENP